MGLFALVVCAPLLLTLLGPFKQTAISPYAPAAAPADCRHDAAR